jgi:hypothetical protein
MSPESDYANVRREILSALQEVDSNIEETMNAPNLEERLHWIELSLDPWVTNDFEPGESLGKVFHSLEEVELVRTIAAKWSRLWESKRSATVSELDQVLLRSFLADCKSLYRFMVTKGT